MRKIKFFIISLSLFCILIFLFSLLIPSKIIVSRAITIAKPLKTVKQKFADLNDWKNWNKELSIANNNHSLLFDSVTNTIETNQYKTKIVIENDTTIKFSTNFKNNKILNSEVHFYNHTDSCSINWFYNFETNWYPWQKFKTIFFDQIYGTDLDSNLINFKKYIEK